MYIYSAVKYMCTICTDMGIVNFSCTDLGALVNVGLLAEQWWLRVHWPQHPVLPLWQQSQVPSPWWASAVQAGSQPRVHHSMSPYILQDNASAHHGIVLLSKHCCQCGLSRAGRPNNADLARNSWIGWKNEWTRVPSKFCQGFRRREAIHFV